MDSPTQFNICSVLFGCTRWCYIFDYIDYLSLIVGSLYLDNVMTIGTVTLTYQIVGSRT